MTFPFPRSLMIDRPIEMSKDQVTAVAWCYCEYRERLSLTPVVFAASILRQLIVQTGSVPQAVLEICELFRASLHKRKQNI